jgi:hypothetical protein
MTEEQDMLVREGKVDFVVLQDCKMEKYIEKHSYNLVAESSMYFEGAERTYYLYKLNDIE